MTLFPAISLPDLEGIERPLAQAWAAGPALVTLGHRDCATTRLALPYVDRIHRRGGSVVVVLQDDRDSARGLVSSLSLGAPVLLEADPYRLARDLDLRTVPTLYVVEPDGTIGAVYEGFKRADLEAVAARLGAGRVFGEDDTAPVFRPG